MERRVVFRYRSTFDRRATMCRYSTFRLCPTYDVVRIRWEAAT